MQFHSGGNTWQQEVRENRSHHPINLYASHLYDIPAGCWFGTLISTAGIGYACCTIVGPFDCWPLDQGYVFNDEDSVSWTFYCCLRVRLVDVGGTTLSCF